MSGNLRLYGTSGYVELQAPASASDQTLVLPTDSIQPGLVHIATESFSNVSSISLDSVFSESYENYRIMLYISSSSATGHMLFRLRFNGADNSSSYYGLWKGLEYTGTSRATLTNNSDSYGFIQIYNSDASANIDVYGPHTSNRTRTSGTASGAQGSTGIGVFGYHGMVHNVSSSFDGFKIFPVSGNFTGTLRIYGYRNGA